MKSKRQQATWTIPAELRLPDSIPEIEGGRKPKLRQLDLLPDDSAMAKLRAIKTNKAEAKTHA